jgi:hypothetical protein
MSFTRTERAQQLMSRYAQITAATAGITKRRDLAWFHDQLALWEAWRESNCGLLGLQRRDAPRLVAMSKHELSIDGSTDAVFVSRRNGVFDTEAMTACLASRNIPISWIREHVDEQVHQAD